MRGMYVRQRGQQIHPLAHWWRIPVPQEWWKISTAQSKTLIQYIYGLVSKAIKASQTNCNLFSWGQSAVKLSSFLSLLLECFAHCRSSLHFIPRRQRQARMYSQEEFLWRHFLQNTEFIVVGKWHLNIFYLNYTLQRRNAWKTPKQTHLYSVM